MIKRKKAKERFIAIKTQHVKANVLILPPTINIIGYEKAFITLRDRSEDEETKYFYDRCRAILKWASTCGAELDDIEFIDDNVVFHFSFADFNSLADFEKDYNDCVSSATEI